MLNEYVVDVKISDDDLQVQGITGEACASEGTSSCLDSCCC